MTDDCGCPPPAGTATCELRAAPVKIPCPTNQQVGKAVDTLTLKALLAVPLTRITSDDYRFCRDPNCPTVYYSADGKQLFRETELRERVYHKHPIDDDALVCYCFRRTVGDIRAELRATGATTVIDAINAGIQAGKCACDIRNPQGSCCLGNVRTLVHRQKQEFGLGM
ncbi:MAG TPA: hypothetical protein VJG32_13370 [Anaerolineae bacterium]|nr:hypothetical protein [Anaerolineae bacterium]